MDLDIELLGIFWGFYVLVYIHVIFWDIFIAMYSGSWCLVVGRFWKLSKLDQSLVDPWHRYPLATFFVLHAKLLDGCITP